MGTANELEQRLRTTRRALIGTCCVDFGLNEVSDGARCTRLMPKAAATLEVLVFSAGKPVSKERLLAEIWRDEFPTEDVITNAICQLRKAFGDDARAPRYIRTLPRVGYVLVAPLAPAPPAEPAKWHLEEAFDTQPSDLEAALQPAADAPRCAESAVAHGIPHEPPQARERADRPFHARSSLPTRPWLPLVFALLTMAAALLLGSAWWSSRGSFDRPLSSPAQDPRGGQSRGVNAEQFTAHARTVSARASLPLVFGSAKSARWLRFRTPF